MSQYSGKCDLFDQMSGKGGWYDKDGNPVKFGQEGVTAYYSDELKDFEAFKKETGGILHQDHRILVTEQNQHFIHEHCPDFAYNEVTVLKNDHRSKTGKRAVKSYIYRYYNKILTLKEINKNGGVAIDVPIKFDTLLDLIPYYPYVITAYTKGYCKIAGESHVTSEFNKFLQSGYISKLDYRGYLQKHYQEVCQKYFLYNLTERVKEVSLIGYKPLHNGYYELILPEKVDYMHDLQFVWSDNKSHSHWTSPKLSSNEDDVVLISEQDIDYYLANDIKNGTVKLRYVSKCDFPLYIS